jgi:hypothetical protein
MSAEVRRQFYRDTLVAFRRSGIPFLIGGAYALTHYTGIRRRTKDLDVFVHPRDGRRTLQYFSREGFETRMVCSYWLAKIGSGEAVVDVIFASRNGICRVDEAWFSHAESGKVYGQEVRVIPPEEMIWSKGYVMERDRFDGADICHLLRARADTLDWNRLLARFGDHWPVLLSHVILFGFVYPSHRRKIPPPVLQELGLRWKRTLRKTPSGRRLCRGPLLAQTQYVDDILRWGYRDARRIPPAGLTPGQIAAS